MTFYYWNYFIQRCYIVEGSASIQRDGVTLGHVGEHDFVSGLNFSDSSCPKQFIYSVCNNTIFFCIILLYISSFGFKNKRLVKLISYNTEQNQKDQRKHW